MFLVQTKITGFQYGCLNQRVKRNNSKTYYTDTTYRTVLNMLFFLDRN